MAEHSKGRRGKKGRVLITLGSLCLLAAALIAGLYLWQDWQAGRTAREAMDQMADAEFVANDEDGVLVIDGLEYLGYIDVPSENLVLPVINDYTFERLSIAPCRYSGGYYTNNLVICGHNYQSHFGPLQSLKGGEDVYFVTASGQELHYQVVMVETLDAMDVEEMKSSEYDLSLFTCTPDALARWTVRCMRVY